MTWGNYLLAANHVTDHFTRYFLVSFSTRRRSPTPRPSLHISCVAPIWPFTPRSSASRAYQDLEEPSWHQMRLRKSLLGLLGKFLDSANDTDCQSCPTELRLTPTVPSLMKPSPRCVSRLFSVYKSSHYQRSQTAPTVIGLSLATLPIMFKLCLPPVS